MNAKTRCQYKQLQLQLNNPLDKKPQDETKVIKNNFQDKQLNSALKEALEENQCLRDRVSELEAMYAESEGQKEIREKAIREIYYLVKRKDEEIDTLNQQIQQQQSQIDQVRQDMDQLLKKQK